MATAKKAKVSAAAIEKNQKKPANSNGGRGGARPGAGRKKGAATTRTREIADRAVSDGSLTPLEVMLENMRFAHQEAGGILARILLTVDDPGQIPEKFDELKTLLQYRGMAQEAAKDAAPYIHPRLAAVEHTGRDGGPIELMLEQIAANPKSRIKA